MLPIFKYFAYLRFVIRAISFECVCIVMYITISWQAVMYLLMLILILSHLIILFYYYLSFYIIIIYYYLLDYYYYYYYASTTIRYNDRYPYVTSKKAKTCAISILICRWKRQHSVR